MMSSIFNLQNEKTAYQSHFEYNQNVSILLQNTIDKYENLDYPNLRR